MRNLKNILKMLTHLKGLSIDFDRGFSDDRMKFLKEGLQRWGFLKEISIKFHEK